MPCTHRFLAFLLLLAPLALVVGCGDDDPVKIEDRPEPWLYAESYDELMMDFRTTYETMDLEVYSRLLHPDFEMHLQAATIDDFPELGDTLDPDEEMTIHTNMFSGAAGRDAEGNLTTPVSSIVFQEPLQLTAWAESLPDAVIPSTPTALFDVKFEFNRGGDKTLLVEGRIQFFAVARDSVVDGQTRSIYQFIGMVDHTYDGWLKDQSGTSFGSMKALWR